MKEKKIYISLKETEDLIFNRILDLPKSRLEIISAQGLFRVSVYINGGNLIEHQSKIIILFSAVQLFEIPEKERSLFLVHYKIPEGLLLVSRRLVKDEDRKTELFDDNSQYFIKKYTLLRNGGIGLYNLTCELSETKELFDVVQSVFYSIFEVSKFKKSLLTGLLDTGKFPIKEVKTDKFVTERYYRAVWLLNLVKQTIVSEISDSNTKELDSTRKWMLDLLEIDDFVIIRNCIESTPAILKKEMACILGYYFAATNFEEFQSDKNSLITFIRNLKVEQENELLSWTKFFISIFDEEIPYLYFSPLIQDDIIEIERATFNHLFFEEKSIEKISLQFNRDYSTQEKAENYLGLTNGIKNQNIEVIDKSQKEAVLMSNLSNGNLKNIGLELHKTNYFEFLGINTCFVQNHYFQLNINAAVNPKDVIFYLDKDSKCDEKLKSIGIKRKSLDKLLPNKKVLLGFVYIEELNQLTELYSAILPKIETIEKVVIVCLFNLQPNQVQSIEFDNMFRDYQSRISTKFNVKCEFIIRNENNPETVEIKRNLKNAIGKYKTSAIELVDENLTHEKMNWVIESSMGYWIEQEGFNYFSFKTQH